MAGQLDGAEREESRFTRLWVLACSASWAVAGFVIGISLVGVWFWIAADTVTDTVVGIGLGIVVLAVGGLVPGMAQWLILRKRLSGSGWWVLPSTVPWVGLVAVLWAISDVETASWLVVAVAVGGAGVALVAPGVAEWLILRKRLRGAGRWVLASTAARGMAIAATAGVVFCVGIFYSMSGTTPTLYEMARRPTYVEQAALPALDGAVGGFLGGAVYGAITGLVLRSLLRHPVEENSETEQDLSPRRLGPAWAARPAGKRKEEEATAKRFLGLERAEWWFLLLWVLASAAGWVVGLVVGKIQLAIGAAATAAATAAVMCGPARRAVTGTAQWLILRRHVQRSGLWMLAIAVGWAFGSVVVAVGWVIVLAWANLSGRPMVVGRGLAVVAGTCAGAVTGTLQWLILRQRVQRAGWWVLVSAVDWAVGWAVGWDRIVVRGVDVRPVALAVASVVYGAITGLVLIVLLRRPVLESSERDA